MSDFHTLLQTVDTWFKAGKRVVVATVLQTWQSAPRKAGTKLFVSDAGDTAGSISAGCVESAVIETAMVVLRCGKPQQLHFGIANDEALEVGLACGGEIHVLVDPYDIRLHEQIQACIQQQTVFSIWTHLVTGQHIIVYDQSVIYHDASLDSSQHQFVTRQMLPIHEPQILKNNWFYEPIQMPFRLVIVGGNHIGVAVAQAARLLSWHTILVDPRTAFANRERFPNVSEIINAYPQKALPCLRLDKHCAVVVLSHDPKFDDPALLAALKADAGYIGALGSKRTQTQRQQRLHEAGISEADIARIHAPIGLDIGASTPEEIAIAIVAEIIQHRQKKYLSQQQSCVSTT